MCIVSNIGDDFTRRLPGTYPHVPPYQPASPYTAQSLIDAVPRYEFEALKKEVEELKELLKAAKKYDEATGQKDCEVEDKVGLLKSLGKALGVDLTEIFTPKEQI